MLKIILTLFAIAICLLLSIIWSMTFWKVMVFYIIGTVFSIINDILTDERD